MMLFVGLEIGGTNLKAGILDGETGKLAGSFRQEPLLFNGSQDVESEVKSACRERLPVIGPRKRSRCVQFFFSFQVSSRMFQKYVCIHPLPLLLCMHMSRINTIVLHRYSRVVPFGLLCSC